VDDPSSDARPANYDPNGEQLDMASQHEPSIIRGEGQCCGHHPHEDPEHEKNRSQDPLTNSSAMSATRRRLLQKANTFIERSVRPRPRHQWVSCLRLIMDKFAYHCACGAAGISVHTGQDGKTGQHGVWPGSGAGRQEPGASSGARPQRVSGTALSALMADEVELEELQREFPATERKSQ
jgi:hypothetical protein